MEGRGPPNLAPASDMPTAESPPQRPLAGRAHVLAAALLWSSSGLFVKSHLFDDWPLDQRGVLLAFWRALFAGLVLLPWVRRPRWNWRMVPMVLSFTGMNICFLKSMTLTTAANAIWLQCTAPLWVFLWAYTLGRERARPADAIPLCCGLAGTGLILAMEFAGATAGTSTAGVVLGLAAGILYAGVVIGLRRLRGEDAAFLVAANHLVAAALLSPYYAASAVHPSLGQLAAVAAFGVVQMGVPYLLFARGLHHVPGHEAALLALTEPVLMPLWVWLAWGERPAWWTLAGGGLILAGLIARYARREREPDAG